MKHQHTPGPWRIVPPMEQPFAKPVGTRVGPAICGVEKAFTTISVHAEPDGKPCPDIETLDALGEANARLICAAPDLLACMVAKLEHDVTPLEYISALLAEFESLREQLTAAGVGANDSESEMLCLSNVRRFLNEATTAIIKATTPETT